ncbi:MAG: stage V sporulation T C-terminal domain-containing protein [Oscillospiraceae bacterium]|nr:stage V sporulation T C-terminal domain-containing protein [Oscillospiraceae bacterium]
MRATGIVRKIDNLGRVVIPKEIRSTMHIREGEPLEIFTDGEGDVIFRKYSLVGELSAYAAVYAEVLAAQLKTPVVVTDLDRVVAVSSSSRRELLERRVGESFEHLLKTRRADRPEGGVALGEDGAASAAAVAPVVVQGSVVGGIAALAKPEGAPPLPEETLDRLSVAAALLGAQCE